MPFSKLIGSLPHDLFIAMQEVNPTESIDRLDPELKIQIQNSTDAHRLQIPNVLFLTNADTMHRK